MKGKIILLYRTDTLKQSFEADATRRSNDALKKMEAATLPPGNDGPARRRGNRGGATIAIQFKDMATAEGAIALLSMSPRGHDGTLFVPFDC